MIPKKGEKRKKGMTALYNEFRSWTIHVTRKYNSKPVANSSAFVVGSNIFYRSAYTGRNKRNLSPPVRRMTDFPCSNHSPNVLHFSKKKWQWHMPEQKSTPVPNPRVGPGPRRSRRRAVVCNLGFEGLHSSWTRPMANWTIFVNKLGLMARGGREGVGVRHR